MEKKRFEDERMNIDGLTMLKAFIVVALAIALNEWRKEKKKG